MNNLTWSVLYSDFSSKDKEEIFSSLSHLKDFGPSSQIAELCQFLGSDKRLDEFLEKAGKKVKLDPDDIINIAPLIQTPELVDTLSLNSSEPFTSEQQRALTGFVSGRTFSLIHKREREERRKEEENQKLQEDLKLEVPATKKGFLGKLGEAFGIESPFASKPKKKKTGCCGNCAKCQSHCGRYNPYL